MAPTVQQQEYKDNIKACLEQKGSNVCDKEKLLETSLHYAMGKVIRFNILTNAKSADDMKTVGFDESGENSDEYWERGLDTEAQNANMLLKHMKEKPANYELHGLDLRVELQERNNFRIDITKAENAALRQGDAYANAVQHFNNYLRSYAGPDEKLFVAAREVKDANNNITNVLAMENGKEIMKSKGARVINYESLKDELSESAQDLANKIKTEEKTDVFPLKDPLTREEAKFRNAAKNIQNCLNKTPCTIEEKDRKILIKLLTKEEMEAIADKSTLAGNKNLIQKIKGIADPEQSLYNIIAESLNEQVDELIEERKIQRRTAANNETTLGKETVTYQLNPENFDNFLDEMWPDNT